ncbi:ABC transporter permease [Enterococcus gallinarum]|uniref:ABC transporter permease n=1 Tax=Enterococcus gallinarum TaxID=1353 RepID=A0ABD4ZNM4_ENTGA|nr:ABC transporter permease [Enterococcus gallinarum]MBF0820282.1 ABC transporter permease [Enterococcus faecalis]MBF0725568.1 ABC transporter permease [Enterococcus gallinarum]MBF0798045.1 ABC transporter permease [Enterococcus gallinarum]MBX8976226.1 ABC transporter permease [Enterococcus gallinarum]MDL4873680.1 ABC transporter permease [Enterococcus gallinarum]
MKQLSSFIKVIRANRQAAVGMYLLLILVGFALLGKWLIGDLPADYTNRLLGPSLQHPLGTDFTGRDTLLQFILGARDVVLIALFSGFFSILIGMSIGIVAGFVGGATDKLLMFLTNVVLTIPSFPVLMALSLVISAGNVLAFGFLLAIWNWAGLARSVRSQVMTLRGSEYILASQLLGMSKGYMIRQDILPSLIPYIAINFVLIMRASVLASVGLMLLGLAPFKGEHWGIMLNLAMTKTGAMFGSSAAIYLITPIVGIVVFQSACFLFSKGLEDAFNPRIRSEIDG